MKRQHNHGNSYKGNLSWLTVQKFSLLVSLRKNMEICRQTWGQRGWDFYILIRRYHEVNWFEFLRSQSPSPVDTLPPIMSHLLKTRTHLLIVKLPTDQTFKHMSLWRRLYHHSHRASSLSTLNTFPYGCSRK